MVIEGRLKMINYKWLENGSVMEGSWYGDHNLALEAAIERLGAEYDAEAGAWTYRAPESGELVLVDEDELLAAGAAVLAGVPNWYGLWCAETGAPVR